MLLWSSSVEIISRIMHEAGAAVRGGIGGGGRGVGRVTSDPADRLILSFQQPPLSFLFTSLNGSGAGGRGVTKRAGCNNEARPGGRLGDGWWGRQRKGR